VSRLQFAPQLLQLFHQFKGQRNAGQINFKVPFQPQREARTAQGIAAKTPFGGVDFNDAEHAFMDKFHDVLLLDGANAAQVLDGE